MNLFGRRVIYSDVSYITRENVVDVLRTAFTSHLWNLAEIEYLYNYRKGEQPILMRQKEVRPEICSRIVVNRADEIVTFKGGYLLGEPVQYVCRSDDAEVAKGVSKLNAYALTEDKPAKDKELADWWHTCGTSYRMVVPNKTATVENDEPPFHIYILDPRNTFVVYSSMLGNPPVLAVNYYQKSDGTTVFSCYSADKYFEITDAWTILKEEPHAVDIPIIEYPASAARLGAFETVIHILDAINTVASNRMDGVEQFIQALMLFHNVTIDEEKFARLRELGALMYRDADGQTKGEVSYLTAELNQSQTQTLMDDMYDTVLTICGMPNRNGGSSTSDTGSAVIMRDGWSAAEARAKDSERTFCRSEKQFLKIALQLCNDLKGLSLKLSDLEIRFTRRNYENITEKANVLVTMLNNDKIHPQLAFVHSGMFSDPQLAYKMSEEYMEAHNADTGIDRGNRADSPQEETGGDQVRERADRGD